MAAMRQQVEQVAAKLQKGTRAYQASQRHLLEVQSKERATARQSAQLGTESAADQRRLDQMVAAAYRRPVPNMMSLALSGGASALPDALSAQADLDHVAGSQQEVLRAAVRNRVRAEALALTTAQLSADARATDRRLARQLADLRRTAARANVELQAAAARLAAAQAAEQARIAAAQAAAAARREAASRARQSAVGGTGPSCTGESTEGYANGFLPDSALCPLWQAGGHRLGWRAAAAFNQMSKYHAASTGSPLCVTDSYRTYGEQVSLYQRKPELAATPGTSEHGWGQAVDFCGGVERYGSGAYGWMQSNAARFGFFHPSWAEPGGGRPEPWHWEFGG
jgi:hypothetical protein